MSDLIDKRRQWFEKYIDRIEQGVMKPPLPGVRYPCPCCGYPTLQERGAYDICPLCNWEDDGQDDPHADEVWGGPNGSYSLSEARENFRQNLIMYNPQDPRIRGSDSLLEKQAKQAIIEAFDKMHNENNSVMLDALWAQVDENEKILDQELHRKIREYEAQIKD